MISRRTWGLLIVAFALVLFCGAWHFSWPLREAGRWSPCIGRPLSTCAEPSGYDEVVTGCAEYLDCSTDPPGASYATAVLKTNRGSWWSSYAYAVIALDADGRVMKVEIKRFYSAL